MEKETQQCINTCNALLRGEISAVEAYSAVLEKFLPSPEIGALRQILEQHQTSCDILAGHVEGMNGEPNLESGAWGTITTTVQAAANLLGEDSAVSCLINGENLGIGLYEQALENDGLTELARKNITDDLLPPLRRNIAVLEVLRDNN